MNETAHRLSGTWTWSTELFATLKDLVEDFWYWWSDEVACLWREAVRIVLKRDDRLSVQPSDPVEKQSGALPFSLYGTQLILNGPFLRIKGIENRLPFSRAQAVAKAIVAEKTPFDCDDVYIFPVHQPEHGTSYFLGRKTQIKPIFDELYLQRRPLRSIVIFNEGVGYPIASNEVKPLHRVFARRTVYHRVLQILCIAALASFLLLYFQMDYRLGHAQSSISEIVETQRSELKVARKSLEERQLLIKTNEAAVSFKRDAVSFIQVWEKLTRLLPDDVWLTDLSFANESVSITGQARGSAASLIPILNASSDFYDPALAAAIVRVPGQAGERFEITMKVKR